MYWQSIQGSKIKQVGQLFLIRDVVRYDGFPLLSLFWLYAHIFVCIVAEKPLLMYTFNTENI